MRRLVPIFSSILLGGLAVAIGMGIFLQKANTDREQLAKQAADAVQTSQEVKANADQTIRDANHKLETANVQIAKAQSIIKDLQSERTLMSRSPTLVPPKPTVLRSWKETVDLPLGIALKYPGDATVENNDAEALTLSNGSGDALTDTRWLSIIPYDTSTEAAMRMQLTTSTPVAYVVGDRLLMGVKGHLAGETKDVYILSVRNGDPTHLIWAKEPDGSSKDSTVLDTLGTMTFEQ